MRTPGAPPPPRPCSSDESCDGQPGQSRAPEVVIVVGAPPRAEQSDRPTAYALSDRIVRAVPAAVRPRPLVCTDLWWLNDPSLRDRPTISIGAPEVNALTAYLADKLPTAFAIDDVLMVQLDPAFGDNLAACWGVNHRQTAAAVDVFAERYLSGFLARRE